MLWCFWLDAGWPFLGEKAHVHPIFALHLQVICSSPIRTESIQDHPGISLSMDRPVQWGIKKN